MKAVRIRRDALPDHPWVYRKQVLTAEPGTRNGDPVRVLSRGGKGLGAGLYHGKSQIAIRVLSRDSESAIDESFLADRIQAAARLRRELLHLDDRTDAYRVVNSEGDGISGLIVDRYGPVLVVQIRCLALFRMAGGITAALKEIFPGARVVWRRDAQSERIEGFRVPGAEGEPRVEVQSDGITMEVDFQRGHKTGSFLDQRDNRLLVAKLAAGRRVLDLFCYEGGFALPCARAGAAEVSGVDLDEHAVERARASAERNGLSVTFRHGDAFEVLRAGPETDLLLLDPPRWISSRADEREGRNRYLDLNTLALSALGPGALLVTSSCSGRLARDDFLNILRQAAHRSSRFLSILEVRGPAPDHPVAASFPEGHYLTTVVAAVTAG